MRSRWPIVAVALSAAIVPAAYGQLSGSVDMDQATIESMLHIAFPGTPITSQGDYSIQIDGKWVPVEGPGYHRARVGAEYIAASGFELPSQTKSLVDKMLRFEAIGESRAATRVVVLRSANDGSVLSHREGVLDGDAPLTECYKLGAWSYSVDAWPRLAVTYSAMYQGPEWVASVDWRGEWDSELGQLVSRIPVSYWKRTKDKAETGGAVEFQRTSGDAVELRFSGRLVPYSCGTDCKVPAALLLTP